MLLVVFVPGVSRGILWSTLQPQFSAVAPPQLSTSAAAGTPPSMAGAAVGGSAQLVTGWFQSSDTAVAGGKAAMLGAGAAADGSFQSLMSVAVISPAFQSV